MMATGVSVGRVADEFDAGFDFWAHRAGAEVAGFEVGFGFVGGELGEALFVGFAVIEAGEFDGGEDHERRRFEAVGEEAGGAVLVDDGGHAVDDAFGVDVDGDAAAAAADDNFAGFDESLDRRHFDDFARMGRSDQPAKFAAAFVANFPAVFRAMGFGLGGSEDRADRFGGFLEGGVVAVDEDGGDDGGDVGHEMAAAHRVGEALGDHVAHAGLRVGDADFERDRVELGRGDFDAAEDVADLRAVAVRDDELVAALDSVAKMLGRFSDLGELLVDRADLARGADGVSAESHHESLTHFGHDLLTTETLKARRIEQ